MALVQTRYPLLTAAAIGTAFTIVWLAPGPGLVLGAAVLGGVGVLAARGMI